MPPITKKIGQLFDILMQKMARDITDQSLIKTASQGGLTAVTHDVQVQQIYRVTYEKFRL